jgi:hypothetical protein
MLDSEAFSEDPRILRRQNVLYLVSELEAALRMGGIGWATEDSEVIPKRLAKITAAVRRQTGNKVLGH